MSNWEISQSGADSPLIRVSNLSLNFENEGVINEVFNDVSFDVFSGEILGILGGNGTGKTSLLKAVAGLTNKSGGSIFSANNSSFSWVPQDYSESFFHWTSLINNIHFAVSRNVKDLHKQKSCIYAVRDSLKINLDLKLRPSKCSGGMLQQAALIRALCNDSQVLLADEPFSALDLNIKKTVRRRFREIIKERGLAAIIILHDLEDIASLCDKVLVIPGRPYSSEVKAGMETIRIIPNKKTNFFNLDESISILSVAEQFLSDEENVIS